MDHSHSPTTPTHARRRSGSLLYNASANKHVRKQSAPGNTIPEAGEGGGQIRVASDRSDTSGATTSDDMEMDDIRSDEDLGDDEETGLTHTERKKRRRRKMRNQRLDQRIAPGGSGGGRDDFQAAEDRLIKANLVKNILINVLLIGLWYGFSIGISVYNKWMFDGKNLNFPYPLFTTSIHMLVQFSLAALVLWIFPRFRPSATQSPSSQGYTHIAHTDEDEEEAGEPSTTNNKPEDDNPTAKSSKHPLMAPTFYLTRIAPCGTATALDIGLGNFSLRFITLTFYTMCKSSVLAFVLLFAFIFRLETPTWRLCLIISLMTIGVILMVSGEAAFNALGFILVMSASFCSGFRWSLTQILLLRNPATSNPFSSIFFLTPVMFLSLFVLALPIEGPVNVWKGFLVLTEAKGTLFGIILMLFPGCLAFMMVAAEFALIKRTSVVTLSVCGIFKEVLTISAASLTFGDDLSPINISGLIVTICSIAGYNILKYSTMMNEAKKEAHDIMDDSLAPHKVRGPGDAADSDEYAGRKNSSSTAGLMRDSLALATTVESGVGQSSTANGLSHGHGPTKRPEDLE